MNSKFKFFICKFVHVSRCYSCLSMTALIILLMTGCGYPTVSTDTYELTQALYSACNRENDEHLCAVDLLIDQKHESGRITDREAEWLRDISSQAHRGDWETATGQARQIMLDQVKKR